MEGPKNSERSRWSSSVQCGVGDGVCLGDIGVLCRSRSEQLVRQRWTVRNSRFEALCVLRSDCFGRCSGSLGLSLEDQIRLCRVRNASVVQVWLVSRLLSARAVSKCVAGLSCYTERAQTESASSPRVDRRSQPASVDGSLDQVRVSSLKLTRRACGAVCGVVREPSLQRPYSVRNEEVQPSGSRARLQPFRGRLLLRLGMALFDSVVPQCVVQCWLIAGSVVLHVALRVSRSWRTAVRGNEVETIEIGWFTGCLGTLGTKGGLGACGVHCS